MKISKRPSICVVKSLLALIVSTPVIFTASADLRMGVAPYALHDKQLVIPIEQNGILEREEHAYTVPVDYEVERVLSANFLPLSEAEILAYMQVLQRLNTEDYQHRSYRTVGVVTNSRQGSNQYSKSGLGTPAGKIKCWDHRAAYPHKGTWHLPDGSSTKWVKAKSKASCEYIHTGPAERPPWIGWSMTLILRADRSIWNWLGFERPQGIGQFIQMGFIVEWVQDLVKWTAHKLPRVHVRTMIMCTCP